MSARAIVVAPYLLSVPAYWLHSANVPSPLFVKHSTPEPMVLTSKSSQPSPLMSAKTAPRQIRLPHTMPDAGRHVLELHPAQVLVQRVVPVQTAKKNVRQPVVVKISDGHPAAIGQHPVGGDGALIQRVGEGDARLLRRQQREIQACPRAAPAVPPT